MHPRTAFTLLELIVVVAIVAIFAAIAIPNLTFDRHVKPGWSRAKSDLRTLGQALEQYKSEQGTYPPMTPLSSHASWDDDKLRGKGGDILSMPVGLAGPDQYLTSLIEDPFAPAKNLPYAYYTDGAGWLVLSAGQDGDYDISDPASIFDGSSPEPGEALVNLTYDATNGTQTSGDIWRRNTPPYTYDPTNGTVSKSEVWRVQQETQEPAKEESDAKP